jgi:hypothetical protein
MQQDKYESHSPAFGKHYSPNSHNTNENLNIINKNPAAISKQQPIAKINISFMGENSSQGLGPLNSSPSNEPVPYKNMIIPSKKGAVGNNSLASNLDFSYGSS